jgi:hypothetical protein
LAKVCHLKRRCARSAKTRALFHNLFLIENLWAIMKTSMDQFQHRNRASMPASAMRLGAKLVGASVLLMAVSACHLFPRNEPKAQAPVALPAPVPVPESAPAPAPPIDRLVVLLDQDAIQAMFDSLPPIASPLPPVRGPSRGKPDAKAMANTKPNFRAFSQAVTQSISAEMAASSVAVEAHTLSFKDTNSRSKITLQNRPTLIIRMLDTERIAVADTSAAVAKPEPVAAKTRGAKTAKDAKDARDAKGRIVPAPVTVAARPAPKKWDGRTAWTAQLSRKNNQDAYSAAWQAQLENISITPESCKSYEACGRRIGSLLVAQMRKDELIR